MSKACCMKKNSAMILVLINRTIFMDVRMQELVNSPLVCIHDPLCLIMDGKSARVFCQLHLLNIVQYFIQWIDLNFIQCLLSFLA